MAQRPLQLHQSQDLPDVLIHLTGRDGPPSPGLPDDIRQLTAWNRLAGVLMHGSIRYGTPFDSTWPVASFMQTTRRAFGTMTRYQRIGIAFHKQYVWDAGGGPAFYVRGDQWGAWREATMPEPLRSMGVRLWPGWDGAPPPELFFDEASRGRSEWLHEREWRLPRPNAHDWGWQFPREAVAFLILRGVRTRDLMLQTLTSWGGDRSWAESLPWVDVHIDGTITGADELWI